MPKTERACHIRVAALFVFSTDVLPREILKIYLLKKEVNKF
jgi:hypothetical protein